MLKCHHLKRSQFYALTLYLKNCISANSACIKIIKQYSKAVLVTVKPLFFQIIIFKLIQLVKNIHYRYNIFFL